MTQVNIFIFNVLTLQDCITQTLNLFLNKTSYFQNLTSTSFNINVPNSNINSMPNSDWLPNNHGSGQSYWYNCVGPNQNYVAYQLQYFALFYSYISNIVKGFAASIVSILFLLQMEEY